MPSKHTGIRQHIITAFFLFSLTGTINPDGGTVESRYLEHGYLDPREARSVYPNKKTILISLSNHNYATETLLQVQITRSAN